jgi:hypothetical protein
MAHIYNPGNSGGKDWENWDSKPASHNNIKKLLST